MRDRNFLQLPDVKYHILHNIMLHMVEFLKVGWTGQKCSATCLSWGGGRDNHHKSPAVGGL